MLRNIATYCYDCSMWHQAYSWSRISSCSWGMPSRSAAALRASRYLQPLESCDSCELLRFSSARLASLLFSSLLVSFVCSHLFSSLLFISSLLLSLLFPFIRFSPCCTMLAPRGPSQICLVDARTLGWLHFRPSFGPRRCSGA